jgi:hypothetical protein
MTKSSLRSLMMAAALVVGAPLVLAGCSDASTESPAERTGSIAAAISTTGADGATYSFPEGAYLYVQQGAFGEYFSLSGEGTTLTLDLPVGTYTLGLYYDSGSVQLERTLAGTTSLIEADWTDPSPLGFSIAEGATTPVVLHFDVEALGDVTFDTGNLEVSLDVDTDVGAEAGELDESGTFTFTDSQFADPSAEYASALSVDLGVEYAQSLNIDATSDWAFISSSTICKSGDLLAATSSSDGGLARRLAQLTGSGSSFTQVCVYDYGETDLVTFYASRAGEAPAEQQGFFPGTGYQFVLYVGAYVGDVFDGTTLKQGSLSGVAVPSGFFSNYIYENGVLLANATGNYTGTLEFGH